MRVRVCVCVCVYFCYFAFLCCVDRLGNQLHLFSINWAPIQFQGMSWQWVLET
jgi:hypothetical protein